MYRNLNPDRIVDTLDTLQRRIDERFEGADLHRVSIELLAVAREARERTQAIEAPIRWLNVSVTLLVLLIVAIIVGALIAVKMPSSDLRFFDFVAALDSGLNDVFFIGAAIFFLVTFEIRVKRNRALNAIHELRSIAHVIDMHQLVKDPASCRKGARATQSSPKRTYTVYELERYLDYCSELLSLTGKVAAIYVQNFKDPIALSAVNEIESLTTGLSRKIWQKIMILPRDTS